VDINSFHGIFAEVFFLPFFTPFLHFTSFLPFLISCLPSLPSFTSVLPSPHFLPSFLHFLPAFPPSFTSFLPSLPSYQVARGGTCNWTAAELNGLLRAVFSVLADQPTDTVADFTRLVTGLSVLCRDGGLKGSGQNEMDAFNMIDRNGDGVITLSEMTFYMEAVFQVIFAVLPHKQQECGVSAIDLADATARQAFVDADVNHDGMITVEEFLLWCSQPDDEQEEMQLSLLMPGLHIRDGPGGHSMSSSVAEFLKQVRATFGLRNVTVAEALGCFEDVNVDEGISKGEFFDCMFDILNLSGAAAGSGEDLSDYLVALFDVFDTDGSGAVDPTELKIGLSLLCRFFFSSVLFIIRFICIRSIYIRSIYIHYIYIYIYIVSVLNISVLFVPVLFTPCSI
jgi:Ca2+-binding EF-hand superfamily protein